MSDPPSARGVAAFLIGFAAVLTLVEAPLCAFTDDEQRVRDGVNEVRVARHLGGLETSRELARVARAHAEDMARQGYLSHVNREGKNPLERTRSAGIEGFRLLAENIGATNITGDRNAEVIRGWMNSPIHRENVLNPAFNTTGVGLAESPAGTTIVVQLYATF